MYLYRAISILCLLSTVSTTWADEQCYQLTSHVEIRTCLETNAKESALADSQVEISLRSALTQWNEEDQYKTRSITKFDAAISQFQHYRKSQCEFQASLAAGGNAASDRGLRCQIDLNEKRIAELHFIMKSLKQSTF